MPGARAGFSLLELTVVVMIIGIVAGIALPSFRNTLFKADAAHIVVDVTTIRVAAYDHLAENGSFPSGGGWGVVPPQMVPHLADGFEFSYKNVQYLWWGFTFADSDNFWGTRSLGIVMISYPDQPRLSEAMKSHMGPEAFWSSTLMWFLFRG